MKLNKYLILIILFVLAFRLFFVFQTDNYSSDESYFHLRYINHILEEKNPLFYDDLSYGGRPVVYPPLFHYILALLSFVPFAFKILPAIFISSLIIIAYLISKEIYANKTINLLIALLAGFIPVILSQTLNQISPLAILLPLSLLMFYSLMKINQDKKYIILFTATALVLPFIHIASLIILFSLLLFLILSNTESINLDKIKQEAILFFSVFTLLISFIIYKKALLLYGFGSIWENTPSIILSQHFQAFNPFNAVYQLGILPFVLGVIGIFSGVFKEKKEHIILLSSLILSSLILLVLKLTTIETGLVFLGMGFTLISTLTLAKIYKYMDLTKFSKYKKYFYIALTLLIIVSAVLPSFFASRQVISNAPSNEEISELASLKDLPFSTAVLGSLDEGHLISVVSGKKNVADQNFLLAPKPDQRARDINAIYTTPFVTRAVDLLKEYRVKYIYLSDDTKKLYGISDLRVAEDGKCFRKVGRFYEVIC